MTTNGLGYKVMKPCSKLKTDKRSVGIVINRATKLETVLNQFNMTQKVEIGSQEGSRVEGRIVNIGMLQRPASAGNNVSIRRKVKRDKGVGFWVNVVEERIADCFGEGPGQVPVKRIKRKGRVPRQQTCAWDGGACVNFRKVDTAGFLR